MAKRRKIPIFHMEAGNRCFDLRVPEEINRKIVDHISDIHMPYSEHAKQNLINEGIHPAQIVKTGSPQKEIFDSRICDVIIFQDQLQNNLSMNLLHLLKHMLPHL